MEQTASLLREQNCSLPPRPAPPCARWRTPVTPAPLQAADPVHPAGPSWRPGRPLGPRSNACTVKNAGRFAGPLTKSKALAARLNRLLQAAEWIRRARAGETDSGGVQGGCRAQRSSVEEATRCVPDFNSGMAAAAMCGKIGRRKTAHVSGLMRAHGGPPPPPHGQRLLTRPHALDYMELQYNRLLRVFFDLGACQQVARRVHNQLAVSASCGPAPTPPAAGCARPGPP